MIPLQPGIIYGPIESRRLGASMGINLLPVGYKLCSFNCVYCQYGRTAVGELLGAEERFCGETEVYSAVEKALARYPGLDYLTFSGNGEPTLHPRFPAIAAGVRRIRDTLAPGVKLAILSNSTMVRDAAVREALGLLDAPIMKLDAGDADTLARINRPVPGVALGRILEGLRQIPGTIVQSVFIDGEVSNARGEAFEAWLEALRRVRPAAAQIYSTERPVSEAGVRQVPPEELVRLAREATRRTDVSVEPFWSRP